MNHDYLAGELVRQRIDTLTQQAAAERLARTARRSAPAKRGLLDRFAGLLARPGARRPRATHVRAA
jgi:hypothetical protein